MAAVVLLFRQAVNLISTFVTTRRQGRELRVVPVESAPAVSGAAFYGQTSPGDWVAPPGLRPGWSWLPPGGGVPNLRQLPVWVRVWYRVPLIDRFAYTWMWHHGGWLLKSPGE